MNNYELADPDKYYIYAFNQKEFVLVPLAEAIDIPGWEGVDLFIHHPLFPGSEFERAMWVISEGMTGAYIGNLRSTKEDTVDDFWEYIKQKGVTPDNMYRPIQVGIDHHGISPRYKAVIEA